MKLEFSVDMFEKYPNAKFYKTLSVGVIFYTEGRTDSHDEAHSSFFEILRKAPNT
jgi:hypothetical protein